MDTIVVGFGNHESSTHTLEWATRLAKRAGAQLIILNVFHRTYMEMAPDQLDELIGERRSTIAGVAERVGHDDVQVEVVEGEAIEELIRFAHSRHADLVVVGHADSMAPGGFGEHGASEALLRSSDVPFIVVKPESPLPDPEAEMTIVVGLDGSSANADSVRPIAGLATDIGATTVPVLSVNTGASTSRDHYGSHLIGEAEARAVAETLPGGKPFRTINESPVDGLIDAAEEDDAICIAIGTRGHRSLSDLFAGQLSRHLIHHSRRAVLVSPHD